MTPGSIVPARVPISKPSSGVFRTMQTQGLLPTRTLSTRGTFYKQRRGDMASTGRGAEVSRLLDLGGRE